MNGNNLLYIDSFAVKHIPKISKNNKNTNENIITNVYRIQANDSIMWEYFCIGFIDFILKGKSLLDYKGVFSSNDHEKNDKIILNYFQ